MATTLKKHLRDSFETNIAFYIRDLESMTHEQLDSGCGGSSRSPYDFTYELVVVHRRIEARLAGRDPGPYPGADGWISAPAEFRSPEAAIREVRESADAVMKACDAVSTDDFEKEIPIPTGTTSAADLMSLASVHATYHDAQLNYIQAIHGDAGMHWQD